MNGLCSTPYSVCVGGTEFNDASNASLYWSPSNAPDTHASAISYIQELAWNESAPGYGLWSSGGGASIIYPKPSWQTGTGVPADGKRDVPDVSLTSAGHDGYLIHQEGSLYVVGGTSAASPAFAGVMALVVQHMGARQGNANTAFYSLAGKQRAGGASVFMTSRAATTACRDKPASTPRRDTIRQPASVPSMLLSWSITGATQLLLRLPPFTRHSRRVLFLSLLDRTRVLR